jgi:hypothetical protein
MIQLVLAAGADSGVYRELDPAVRAYLGAGDTTPILRLVAQTIDPASDSGAVAEFSAGLYVANACNDYPQPFSYGVGNAQRRQQYAAAVAALPRDLFAPFTVDEWVTSGAEEFDSCLKWPAPQTDDPPITARPPLVPATLPVLVLSGELDSLTTPAEGQRVAAQLGPSARWVRIGNMVHVSAMLDFVGCASGLVRRFIRNPGQPSTLDTTCASHVPEIHVVGSFPVTLAAATPAAPAAGNQAGADGRRLAAIGAAVVGDTVWHWWYVPGVRGDGLRGGRWRFDGDGPYTATLTNVRWTTDVRVDGTLKWNQNTGHITADLTVAGPGGLTATVSVAYDDYVPGGVATLTGTVAGKLLAATVPNP